MTKTREDAVGVGFIDSKFLKDLAVFFNLIISRYILTNEIMFSRRLRGPWAISKNVKSRR